MKTYYDRYMGSGYNMPTDIHDEAARAAGKSASERAHELFQHAGRSRGVFTLPGEGVTFTPDPMVRFLEEQVAKLEVRLRASEAHCRRYAVAVAGFRSAAHQGLTVLRTIAAGVEIGKDAAGMIVNDITEADKLIDPVATEAVK